MEFIVDFDIIRKKDKEILKIYTRKDYSTKIIEKELIVPFLCKTKDEKRLNLFSTNWTKLKNNIYFFKTKPKIARELIRKFGIDISINELLLLRYPKFSLIERIDDKLKIGDCDLEKKIEYFEKEKYVVLDIENFSFNEELYCLGLLYNDKGVIYHTLAYDKNKIENFDVFKLANEKEIIKKFSEEINNYDPYFIVLHWGQHDFRILQKLGFKFIRFRGKKEKSKEGMPTKVKFLGKNIFDTCLIARAFFPELPNFKLETLAKYFLNSEIKKYEIEELDELAKKGKENKEAGEEIIKYNIRDLNITKSIFEIFKNPMIKLSLSFKRNIEDIVLGEKVENSFKIFRQKKAELLYKNKEFGDFLIFTKKEQKFLSKKDFNELRKEIIGYAIDEKYKQGVFNCFVVYPLFLQKIFSNLVSNFINKDIQKFFEKGNEIEKEILVKGIDYFLAYPLFEYFFIKNEKENLFNLDKWFGYTFLLDNGSYVNSLDKKISKIKENFYGISSAIVNYGKYIFIDSDIVDKNYFVGKKFWSLEKEGFFNVLKKAVCYSIDKGKIVYYTNKKLFDEGFELSKKIPTRCELINSMLIEFFYRLFEKGTRNAVNYVVEIGKKIKNKEIDYELLAFKGIINKKPYEYINKTFKSEISKKVSGKYKLWFGENGFTDKKEMINIEEYLKHISEIFDPIIDPLYKTWKKEFFGQLGMF